MTVAWDGRMAGSPSNRFDDDMVQAECLVAECSVAGVAGKWV